MVKVARVAVLLGVLGAVGACSSTADSPQEAAPTPPAASTPAAPTPTPTPAPAFDPSDAWGPDTAALPPGATIVTVDAFKDLLAKSDMKRFEGPKELAKEKVATDTQRQKDDQTIADFLANNPDPGLAALLTQEPDPADPAVHKLADGSYRLSLVLADGTTTTTTTLALATVRADVAASIREFGTRANAEALYRYFYDLVPPDPAGGSAFLDPTLLPTIGDAELKVRFQALVADRRDRAGAQVAPAVVSPQFPSCKGDLGQGGGGDGSTGAIPGPAPGGLFALASWPNKQNLTCVKQQGGRGTCVAFAVTSAMETYHAATTGERVNLAEQRLYAGYKYSLLPDPYADGAYTYAMFGMVLLSAAQGSNVPYESDWDYNPSWSRVSQGIFMSHSCDGYAEACSDTTHQLPYRCTLTGGFSFCAFEWPKVNNVSKVGPGFANQTIIKMSNLQDRAQAVAMAISTLVLGDRPVVASFQVMPSFASPSGGYIANAGGTSKGGHAVHLAGWVDNAQLPSGVTPAAGGGYFIVKNSWGTGWADGGFGYMPAAFLQQFGTSIVAL